MSDADCLMPTTQCQVAVRPTLDDGSSSDSCDSSSSGSSSSDDDDITSGDFACSAQNKLHHSRDRDCAADSHHCGSPPAAHDSDADQAAECPRQFWSAFISVRRLPGVNSARLLKIHRIHTHTRTHLHTRARSPLSLPQPPLLPACVKQSFSLTATPQVALRRISRGAPKHQRRDGCSDPCIASRYLACDGLEQARRLAILAAPFACVIADVREAFPPCIFVTFCACASSQG